LSCSLYEQRDFLLLHPLTLASLAGTKFTVFGLGNTQYEFYNAMGKLADEKMAKLGGEKALPLGMGDDDKSMEEDWEAWKDEFWAKIAPATGKEAGTKAPARAKPAFTLTKATTDKPKIPAHDYQANSTRYYFDSFEGSITDNRELRSATDGGSTKHIEVRRAKRERSTTALRKATRTRCSKRGALFVRPPDTRLPRAGRPPLLCQVQHRRQRCGAAPQLDRAGRLSL